MVRSITLSISILLISAYSGFTQNLDFYRESITMILSKEYFHVSGEYYIQSEEPGKHVLFYPLPAEPEFGEVDSVFLVDMINGQSIEILEWKEDKFLFEFETDQNSLAEIQISYRQKLLGQSAKYILKTTIMWKKPLEKAEYQLVVRDNLDVIEFSIPPHKKITGSTETIYLWDFEDYMPAEDLIFRFRD
jgi:hypothetical protein